MIFAGDVAIANHDDFAFSAFPSDLLSRSWCINLEGAVNDSDQSTLDSCVYNNHEWPNSLCDFHIAAVFLGNNHIQDLSEGIASTEEWLHTRGIAHFGAGQDAYSAARALPISVEKSDFLLLGFGWGVIGCRAADRCRPGVNALKERLIIDAVARAVSNSFHRKVVVVFHWNYELELYPQPAHRRLARKLIEMGVWAVVGHHPHIVGPVERHQGRTIAYSLGNWAFSYGRFFGGKLRFPEATFPQIALELGLGGDKVHHALFCPPSRVEYQDSENVHAMDFSLRPVFEGIDDKDYEQWFRENRIKRLALPIYRSASASPLNTLRDLWVGIRQTGINFAVRLGAKDGIKDFLHRGRAS